MSEAEQVALVEQLGTDVALLIRNRLESIPGIKEKIRSKYSTGLDEVTHKAAFALGAGVAEFVRIVLQD